MICQSCGMPLKDANMHGTDVHGDYIEDYCQYCYKDGVFTQDVTMEEMIHLCAMYVKGNNKDKFIADMRKQFPLLKRWAQKEQTQHEYHKSISRVLEYIQSHLSEETDLKTLSGIANISPYHFHRIFRNTIGESVAGYVQRLRLEYVAEMLKTSRHSLSELAVMSGYSSEQALSRAFKKHFSLPPRIFKASFFNEKFGAELIPRICKVTGKHVIMLKDNNNWQKLYSYAVINRLFSESTESVEVIDELTFHPALTTADVIATDKFIHSKTLPEGLYAIFTHKGSIEKIPELFQAIQNHWLLSSKYKIMPSAFSYVVYLSNSRTTSPENFLSEIYVPVIK